MHNTIAPRVWFTRKGSVVVRDNPCYAAFDEVPAKDLVRVLRELHPEAKIDTIVFGCDEGVLFRAVLDALLDARAGLQNPHLRLALAGSCERGAELEPTAGSGVMPPATISAPVRGLIGLPPEQIGKAVVEVGSIEAPSQFVASIASGVAAVEKKLAACYAKSLKEFGKKITGKLAIKLEFGKLGGVISVDSFQDTMIEDNDLLLCLADQLSVLEVTPKPSGRVHVKVPLDLRPR
jgi:hypothetical protein